MTIEGKGLWRRVCIVLGVVATSVSCAEPEMAPSPLSGSLQVTVVPNPIVESGVGACVNAFAETPPGTFRLFPYSVTVDETGGVGVALQSFRITVLSGGQEFPAVDLAAGDIGARFNACGGEANRLGPLQRRCTPTSPFCSPVALPVPEQLRVRFTAIDDNGNNITNDRTVNLTAAQ
jgi:hypothetical protein